MIGRWSICLTKVSSYWRWWGKGASGHWLIESGAKVVFNMKAGKGGRQVIDWLVESVSKTKMSNRGGKGRDPQVDQSCL